MSVIVKLLSKFDDSGIKKAQHGFGGLKKTLAGIGIGLGLKQVADVLLDAAKAASADAKSTKLLNMQLTKNAGATKDSLKQNDKFIESLSLQTGILDDDLRPSLAKFGNVTKNVKQAQKLLKIQLDVVAGSGKSSTKVANSLAKAYAGNTKSLIGMFPELKNSKNALADLTKEFSGAALVNADPFMKFNNSMDILKEKLGNLVLPMIADFVTEMTKPGGIVQTVGKFLTDMANPKTKPGKMFKDIKDAVKDAFQQVKDFFALFGNGDAMKGFANVASTLVKMLPALLALKGIMMLASATKTIKNLATAMGLIAAKGGGGGNDAVTISSIATTVAAVLGISVTALLSAMASIIAILGMSGDATNKPTRDVSQLDPKTGGPKHPAALGSGVFNNGKGFASNQTNNITINVAGADPKATVDALGKYVKNNGSLPASLFPGIKKN
jgi:hypothetical protein